MDQLRIVGARQHNLKNISCDLPRNKLVVLTGPSGSGKSTLAFDTIYAEAQRRYVESLSAYARQFLEQLPKPDVDSIEGLNPAIAIAQTGGSRNPRSTVGTATEIADYLRLLFARTGVPRCPVGGEPLKAYTVQEMVDEVMGEPEGTRVVILARTLHAQPGPIDSELERLRRQGFVRVQINGAPFELGDGNPVLSAAHYDVEVVIDRLVVKPSIKARLTDSVELALRQANGTVLFDFVDRTARVARSEHFRCPTHDVGFESLEPQLFSFNSPNGACPKCSGLGFHSRLSAERVVGDPKRSLREGVLLGLGAPGSVAAALGVNEIVKAQGVEPDIAWEQLPEATRRAILWGSEKPVAKGRTTYPGVLPLLERLATQAPEEGELKEDGALSAEDLPRFYETTTCSECNGTRLRTEALWVQVAGLTIADVADLQLGQLRTWLDDLAAANGDDGPHAAITGPLLRALRDRVGFLIDVGLDYLSLSRRANTLSGGEAQRIRLATQLGASLVGVLYVLDEPSAGLHARDHRRLLDALRRLVDRGNSVLLVEHDRDAMLAADYLVDMGPGAGRLGGTVVAQGTPAEIQGAAQSLTGAYLRGDRTIYGDSTRRKAPTTPGSLRVRVRGARAHNLKGINVTLPVGCMTAVTGASGSGKSSLIVDTLLVAARAQLSGAQVKLECDGIDGLDAFDKVVSIDQSPIGRTPRSNPATFTGILAQLRELYAALPESRARGYKANRFSFNVKGGRCEACRGDGVTRVEMQFLPDVYVQCEVCKGARFNRETLEVRYRGLTISDVLASTVDAAAELFVNSPKLEPRLSALQRIGLGYLQLGQPASTLSGGEAQRLKLAAEFARKATGRTLYVLDEPTTGLHFSDIEVLLQALVALRESGNTVVLIEHNLEVVAQCDWVIDLGPEGGGGGGQLLVEGPPTLVASAASSHTGRFLRDHLPRA